MKRKIEDRRECILLTRPTKEGNAERTECMMAAEENAKYCRSVRNICSEGLSLVTREERARARQRSGHKCFIVDTCTRNYHICARRRPRIANPAPWYPVLLVSFNPYSLLAVTIIILNVARLMKRSPFIHSPRDNIPVLSRVLFRNVNLFALVCGFFLYARLLLHPGLLSLSLLCTCPRTYIFDIYMYVECATEQFAHL